MGKSQVEAEVDEFFDDPGAGATTGEQMEMLPQDEILSKVADVIASCDKANLYEVKMSLIIKPKRDNSLKTEIPVIKGTLPKEYVEEVIDIAMKGKLYRTQVRALVGEPSGQLSEQLKALEPQQEEH
jgi:hypothetical protein